MFQTFRVTIPRLMLAFGLLGLVLLFTPRPGAATDCHSVNWAASTCVLRPIR